MSLTNGGSFNDKVAFIWSVADLLRGDYRQSEYGRVILPLVVIRRLDCVLAGTKAEVIERAEELKRRNIENRDRALRAAAGGREFYNESPLDLRSVLADPGNVADQLRAYIGGFSPSARDVIDKFRFDEHITRLDQADLLYLVLSKFADLDLHPATVGNTEMGYIYEELIRRFSEQSNETAGEHFTPREVIRLMVNLLFIEDADALTTPGAIRTLFDPACGTGGMLAVAEDYLRELNPTATLEVFGQELNDESYAICRSDMMLKGHSATNIVSGNSFSADGFPGQTFDYLLANPPFGVEWKKVETVVKNEARQHGFAGRFGAGLPKINDGSLLFLQHMISKMRPSDEGGSRVAIVFNGSPLFTGAAGSGESEIRRWIIENDWLEAVVALPDQLFYNTGISTYFWVVTNRKSPERRGKVQLVDARDLFVKMRKSLGEKRKQISDDQIAEITRLYGDFVESDRVKILPNEAFGFMRITVERPLRVRYEVTFDGLDEFFGAWAADRIDPNWHDALRDAWTGITGSGDIDPDAFLKRLSDALPGPLRLAPYMDIVRTRKTKTGDDTPAMAFAEWIGSPKGHKDIGKALLNAFTVRDPDIDPVTDRRGNPLPDTSLRDQENVPLPPGTPTWEPDPSDRLADEQHRDAVDQYLTAEVHPWVPDAWVDHTKTKIAYEIPLTRHFYKYVPPRPLDEIDAEIKALEVAIADLLRGVTE